MMRIFTAILLVALFGCIGSCKKERIEERPDYVGIWTGPYHYSPDGFERIEIGADGSASFSFENNDGRRFGLGRLYTGGGRFAIKEGKMCIGRHDFIIDSPPRRLETPTATEGLTNASHAMEIDGTLFFTEK